MELLLVRHAQPERVVGGAGPADPRLTDRGHRQAELLANWLVGDGAPPPDRIVSSSMRRARETADAIARRCGIEVEIDPRLAEFDLGASEYVPLELAGEELLSQAAHALTTGVWGDHRFDPEEFRSRVDAGFGDLLASNAGHRVVVVCHGGVLNSWLSGFIGRPHGMFFLPDYASLSRVRVGDEGSRWLESLNEAAPRRRQPA